MIVSALIDRFELAELPARAQAFRQDVQAFLKAELPPLPADRRARSWMGFDAGFSRKLAARGWVGVTLPRAYGGAEMDAFSRFVLIEELLCAGAPVSAHWIADRQSGPQIRKFGSEAQRSFYLPRICRGEAFFCIGMSEPNSGSDLASVGTRATRRADGGWTLSGRKIWTTNAQHCHYMIALVRTSGTPQDRNQGLSQFIVDLSLPGVTVRPISDLAGDAHFSEVFFDDVQLSDETLIGQEGSGWEQVTAELAFERSGPERIYSSMVLLDGWIQWLRGRGDVSQTAAVGRYATHLAALRNLSLSVTARLAAGESPVVEAALVKELGTTFEQEIPAAIEAALGSDPGADIDAELLRTCAYVNQVCPTYSLRGGTREILRGMIARGLGLR
ncbi:acyl-CoA dehydrogenase, N-terminal domain protein [Bordetella bronchiseptica E012]|uniref:Putative acyl-CoA dehydrogenase n=1 Tax=Bordetella bronchiseptica 253 TaxID=568707 RepID=A0A0C6NZC5_BORBO|nr:acyl-CoA dehydrogenase [Bordetella bronchiseptica]KDB96182.1 acyl-CoA dehydrogenase, N-terminal domain protein [Bordetella bronchiseptica D993]KDB99299.1 acyl-CoA dehydrogenase, N-terminal domain protein [Bordetella bronchiseptica E010]KDC05504.1 acyl-CoA dehydrogenase, N-terminal domain protein [Bordetella bronchiseptica E012]KDC64275.1 acyl-CoA dehydrogenase, N-terminal domain protein [Bordetella bronchiseptica MBORD624]KDD29842.1 acyl-CoA dehydrogenase, N-terminal domain protein [Bordete